jgi:uncharacterized membrane protein
MKVPQNIKQQSTMRKAIKIFKLRAIQRSKMNQE